MHEHVNPPTTKSPHIWLPTGQPRNAAQTQSRARAHNSHLRNHHAHMHTCTSPSQPPPCRRRSSSSKSRHPTSPRPGWTSNNAIDHADAAPSMMVRHFFKKKNSPETTLHHQNRTSGSRLAGHRHSLLITFVRTYVPEPGTPGMGICPISSGGADN